MCNSSHITLGAFSQLSDGPITISAECLVNCMRESSYSNPLPNGLLNLSHQNGVKFETSNLMVTY